ncbi:hypothetical protein A9Q79_07435 [Methylophaga sp. 42_25_T18]|nr:hypothetical protein A9Q79_07435 [Methylophaga sp. 42_25_T18]OUR88731.1 hypothetical protein A9Q92_02515 [Methylophaga sp. 42_8_T64]
MTEISEQSVQVQDIMTSPVLSVKLSETVSQVLKLAKKKNVTGFPIVDDKNKVIGIVSTLDLITLMAVGKQHLKLGELPLAIKVDKEVLTLSPSSTTKEAIKVLIKNRVGRIIVIDKENKPCGIVTRKDLVNYFIDIYKLEK